MNKSFAITGFVHMRRHVAICKPLTSLIFRNFDYFGVDHWYFKAWCTCCIFEFLI